MSRRRPLGERSCAQIEIPMPTQWRYDQGREPRSRYRAILALRAKGARVYRAGHHHMVNGKLLTTAQLFLLERAVGGKSDASPVDAHRS